jgi:ABC-type multidrug transport system permease subunit
MIFLCGLFFPVMSLPVFIRPLSYILPITCVFRSKSATFSEQTGRPFGVK